MSAVTRDYRAAYKRGRDACRTYYADPLRDDTERSGWPQNPYPEGSVESGAWRYGWNTCWIPAWSRGVA